MSRGYARKDDYKFIQFEVQEYYEDGDVARGEKYTATITLASALEAEDQVIGVAEEYGEE